MRTFRHPQPSPERRGAALLLSVLVLFILIAIVYQIRIGTMTDARVGQNDVGLSIMERAIDSAKWDVYEMLKVDAEEEASDTGSEPQIPSMGAGEEAQEADPPADSFKDEWARIQRTTINEIDLRILVEAENAKYNVLNVLTEDEEEAEEAFQRVVRIIDLYRENSGDDISDRDAEDMAREMKDYLLERTRSDWPQPELLTFDQEREGLFMPMSLRDFLVLESWHPHYFGSYRDENDLKVHSLDQFLTIWSSPGLASDVMGQDEFPLIPSPEPQPDPDDESDLNSDANSESSGGGGDESSDSGGSSGGYGVNLNLAPLAVLAGLFDDRDVRTRFWDDVLEYRNLDEEVEGGGEDEEPLYDQFNEEIRDMRAFETLEELSEVRSWDDHDSETQSRIMSMLETQSEVFTIYITARKERSVQGGLSYFNDPREKERQEEEPGGALVRTVRCVVWRRSGSEGVEIVPIIPWEVLDHRPYEVEDYPDEY